MTLYVNACVRTDSRTKRLAECYLEKYPDNTEELQLENVSFPVVNREFLDRRDELISDRELAHPMFELANQFAKADRIVMAAPYYDLSFPSMLKQYIEQINVLGITFRYSKEGRPVGLCNAGELVYITTAGGPHVNHSFGYGYVEALAKEYYGIRDVKLISAEGLDIYGADPEKILRERIATL